MKVFYTIVGLGFGGAEAQLAQLAPRLRAKGHEICIVTILDADGHAPDMVSKGIPVWSLGVRTKPLAVVGLAQLASLVYRVRPDVVHGFGFPANLMTRLVRLVAPVPVLVSTGVGTHEMTELPARVAAYRLTNVLCDTTTHVSAVSASLAVRAGSVPVGGIRAIPCGVEVETFFPAAAPDPSKLRLEFRLQTEFLWLAVGRLNWAKDYTTMITGAESVIRAGKSFRLAIRGSGDTEDEVRREIGIRGLEDTVRLLVERVDLPRLMRAADAFVLSSIFEGMPAVLVEAAACGLPIVATDVGGNREVVLDGINGFVVPPKDPEALAAAMLKVMRMSPEERRAMGLAGRKLVEEKYDFDIVAAQYEALYNELLAKKGRRVRA